MRTVQYEKNIKIAPWVTPLRYCNFDQIFYILRGSWNNAPLLIQAKVGMREYTHCLHSHTKFHLNVFIVSASGGQKKNTILGKFWYLTDSCTDPLIPMMAKFGVLEQTHSLRSLYKFPYYTSFVSIGLFCRPLAVKKPQILPFYWLWHFVVWKESEKVEHGCTTTKFPYPMASKLFLYSNAFMAKLCAQNVTLKCVSDKQTDRQTDKKLNVFAIPGAGEIRAPPNLARCCTLKTFDGLTHSFTTRRRQISPPIGAMCCPSGVKTSKSPSE